MANTVAAPLAQPPALGLLASAITPAQLLDRIQPLGYLSEACGGYRLVDPCSDTEINRGYPLDSPNAPTVTTATTGGTLVPGTYSLTPLWPRRGAAAGAGNPHHGSGG